MIGCLYTVDWIKTARDDLQSIVNYLHRHNHAGAVSVFALITVISLDPNRYPERGRSLPELLSQSVFDYRELTIGNWRLIYKLADSVTVVAVLDGRRSLEDILLQRLLGLDV